MEYEEPSNDDYLINQIAVRMGFPSDRGYISDTYFCPSRIDCSSGLVEIVINICPATEVEITNKIAESYGPEEIQRFYSLHASSDPLCKQIRTIFVKELVKEKTDRSVLLPELLVPDLLSAARSSGLLPEGMLLKSERCFDADKNPVIDFYLHHVADQWFGPRAEEPPQISIQLKDEARYRLFAERPRIMRSDLLLRAYYRTLRAEYAILIENKGLGKV